MSRHIQPRRYSLTLRQSITGSTEPNVARHRGLSRIVVAAMVILQLACTGCQLVSAPQSPAIAKGFGNAGQPLEQLTPQEQQASQIAAQNGDREYLMVDKAHGKIALFEDGALVLSAAALTGENKSDRLPPGTLEKEFSQLGTLDDKVTPAGRFTVSRNYDDEYGTLFDINEIQGRDWTISIHQVYLGTPSERRADRLQSARHEDKHITHGCINVTRETLQLLIDRLPKNSPTVLYILPHDQNRTADYLTNRD
jgi:L,D-transpeptidase catalytic domain